MRRQRRCPANADLHDVAGHALEFLGLDSLAVEQVAPVHLKQRATKTLRKHRQHGRQDTINTMSTANAAAAADTAYLTYSSLHGESL